MKNYKYLPELTVRFSDNVSICVEGRKTSQGYSYWEKETFSINKNQNGEKYLFLPKYNKETGIVTLGSGSFYGFGQYTNFYVIPNAEVSNILMEKKNTSGVIPTIVPPAYTTPEQIANFLIKGKFVHRYENQMSVSGYNVERMLNHTLGKRTVYFNDNDFILNNYVRTVDKSEAQKRILHTIVLNEFVAYAARKSKMNMKFDDYISDNKNVEHIKEKFSTFNVTYTQHTDAIVKYTAQSFGRIDSPLHFEVLNTLAKREAMRHMTAQNVVDFTVGVTGDYDYTSRKLIEKYEPYSKIDVLPTTYKIEKVIVDIFNHLNDAPEKSEYDFFNTTRESVDEMLVDRCKEFFGDYIDNTTRKEAKEVSKNINRLTSMYQPYTRNLPMLSVVFNALGEEYLTKHIRPTNLFMLSRLFVKPSETLRSSSYLKTIAVMIVDAVDGLENDEYGIRAKDYVCDVIYDIVSMKNKCVVYRGMGTMNLSDMTNNFSYDDFPPYMISNILFTDYNNLDGIGKFKYDKDIKNLRAVEDSLIEKMQVNSDINVSENVAV